MRTRVDDAVHVEVKIVELDTVGIRLSGVDTIKCTSGGIIGGVFDAVDKDVGVLLRDPAEVCGDSHCEVVGGRLKKKEKRTERKRKPTNC